MPLTSKIQVVAGEEARSVLTDPTVEYTPQPIKGHRYEVEVKMPPRSPSKETDQ